MCREVFSVELDPRNSQGMKDELTISFVMLLLVLLFCGGVAYLQATNEAAAFNRLTAGPKVTVWDAVWLDLRVEAR